MPALRFIGMRLTAEGGIANKKPRSSSEAVAQTKAALEQRGGSSREAVAQQKSRRGKSATAFGPAEWQTNS
jgi:hypothetical protein